MSKKNGRHIRRATKTQASIFGLCPAPNSQVIGGLRSEQAARLAPLRQKSCKPDKHPTIRRSSVHRPSFDSPSSVVRQTALRRTSDRPPRSHSFLLCSSDYSLTPPPCPPSLRWQGDDPTKKKHPYDCSGKSANVGMPVRLQARSSACWRLLGRFPPNSQSILTICADVWGA